MLNALPTDKHQMWCQCTLKASDFGLKMFGIYGVSVTLNKPQNSSVDLKWIVLTVLK